MVIDIGDLNDKLNDFGVRIQDNDEVIDKINKLAHYYHLDEDALSDELISVLLNNKCTEVDMMNLQEFEKRSSAGEVIFCLRGEKFQEVDGAFPSTAPNFLTLVSKPPNRCYGAEKASVVVDAKLNRFAKMAQVYRDHYPEIQEWGNVKQITEEPVFIYGEIMRDAAEGLPLGERTALLMLDDDEGSDVRLDLSNAGDVAIFLGQFVALKGTVHSPNTLLVEKFFVPPPLPLAQVQPNCSTSALAKVDIWCAAGPFTSAENCAYEQLNELLDNVCKEKPTVLILTGPFIDNRNKYIKSPGFSLDYTQLFTNLLARIRIKLNGCPTEVIFQPSSHREMIIRNIFPAPEFSYNEKPKDKVKFHFVPDGCVIRICGGALEVALVGCEDSAAIGSHSEVSQDATEGKSLLSSQRSLYPLNPPAVASSLQDIEEVCQISAAPNLAILPSILPPSAKKLDRTVFVNPGALAKGSTGTYAKISTRIPIIQTDDRIDLAAHSAISLVRI
ncbi:unnamed protein product [Caenorhabditis auriculariae]|uniref:DNA polymerase alpha subunit B n=1 Tax=Caenorhabditis auriculariae TaxID=2777116 RepID=A0A8S1GWF8_9PELO|nr:unnamed protein product [Caenorhabditis auriculariae]